MKSVSLAPIPAGEFGRYPLLRAMTEIERQKARAELIRGISIDGMIAALTGKTYGQLVQAHLRKLGAQLPAGIAASVALCTPNERAASEAIIDDYKAKGYDAAFWASDAGEILTSVSCDLNDALFPDTADEADVFNLFQLITQNFALMAREQKAFHEFIFLTPSRPPPPMAAEHGIITKMLGIAVNDCDAGRITQVQLIYIFQEAIDNGDILEEENELYIVAHVLPLVDAGLLRPSKHLRAFEDRMNKMAADFLCERGGLKGEQSRSGRWWQLWKRTRLTVLAIGSVVILVGGAVLVWNLNASLGYRRGEIDKGRWYAMKSSSGDGTWLQKGIDPGNQFLDSERTQGMFEHLPNYVETRRGYGAIYIDIGWLGGAYLSSSGWHLFASEQEAVEFLRTNRVEDRRITYLYR